MQLHTGESFDVVSHPAEPVCKPMAELGPGFVEMPKKQSIPMIEQAILSWTPGRAAAALWLVVQRGVGEAWAATGSEARS